LLHGKPPARLLQGLGTCRNEGKYAGLGFVGQEVFNILGRKLGFGRDFGVSW
jgi:hypothetical protein